jgi:hypothetical protein
MRRNRTFLRVGDYRWRAAAGHPYTLYQQGYTLGKRFYGKTAKRQDKEDAKIGLRWFGESRVVGNTGSMLGRSRLRLFFR